MLSKRKKALMFLDANGKCEYCERDMILSFGVGHTLKNVPDNLATFDHKYNRDSPERTAPQNGEKRIFIVCAKCNTEKSKIEPNLCIPKSPLKTANKLVPKEKWSDEKFMQRILDVTEREMNLNRRNAEIEKSIRVLQLERIDNNKHISKAVTYRSMLLKTVEQEIPPPQTINP